MARRPRDRSPKRRFILTALLAVIFSSLLVTLMGCQHGRGVTRTMEVTAYCHCGECNGYQWGSSKYLRLDIWNRYVNHGPRRGERYTGQTAGGGRLRTPRPGLFSTDSLDRPWMIPVRILLPWLAFPRKGTIAADTDHYPFGTVMHVPGWGWGVVDDVGGAIKGPRRLDLLHSTHWGANRWGRRSVRVEVYPPR